MSISIEKTEVALFSCDNKDATKTPTVYIKDSILKENKTPKFLGVTFDRSLSFATHVKNVTAKAIKRNNILKTLSGKDWGCNDENPSEVYI